jgi:hypothetical protein
MGASFCSRCGSSLDVAPLDLVATSVGAGQVPDPPSTDSRFGTLAAVVVLVGLVGLLLVSTRGNTSGDQTPEPVPDEHEGASLPTTSLRDATTTEPATSEPATVFVNDTPGPVLDDGIGGTLVSGRPGAIHRIDLATGETRAMTLAETIGGLGNPWRPVVIDDELFTSSAYGEEMIRTDLVTGDQAVFELDVADQECCYDIVGRAGSDSVWLSNGHLVAHEVDLSGQIRRQVELPQEFGLAWARGDHLYLDGPDGQYRYDATAGTATRIAPIIDFDPVTTVSCEEDLRCQITVETATGPVALPEVTGADLSNGPVRVSPDHTSALVQNWTNGPAAPPTLIYVDLVTGDRTELDVQVDLWADVMWVPHSRWIIPLGDTFTANRSSGMLAVNTETAERKYIDGHGLLLGLDVIVVITDEGHR